MCTIDAYAVECNDSLTAIGLIGVLSHTKIYSYESWCALRGFNSLNVRRFMTVIKLNRKKSVTYYIITTAALLVVPLYIEYWSVLIM